MQLFLRAFFITLIITPYILSKRKTINLPKGKPLPFFVFLVSFPLYILFFTISVNTIKVANAFFYIFISTTITSYVIGNIYFKEKITKREIIASLLLLAGLFLFAFPFTFLHSAVGILAGIFGGILSGISNATRKFYDGKINRWFTIFLQMLVGTVIGAALALFTHGTQIINWNLYASVILFLFVILNVAAQYLLFVGLKNFDLNLSSVVLASQLLFVLLVGAIFLKELPTTTELLASIIVLTAIILSKVNVPMLKLS